VAFACMRHYVNALLLKLFGASNIALQQFSTAPNPLLILLPNQIKVCHHKV
jgi:hypothetical protein